MTRKATVMGTDTTKIVGMQTETIGGKRSAQIGGLDSTESAAPTHAEGGGHEFDAGSVVPSVPRPVPRSASPGAAEVTISAGGAVTITSASVTITAGVINLVVGQRRRHAQCSRGRHHTSLVSPLYTPGVANA